MAGDNAAWEELSMFVPARTASSNERHTELTSGQRTWQDTWVDGYRLNIPAEARTEALASRADCIMFR